MKFNNIEIYNIASNIAKYLQDLNEYIPAKTNFFLQKNINIITEAAKEIEEARIKIAEHYGELNKENNEYNIPVENKEKALIELEDLFKIEQEIDIKTISITDLEGVKLTPMQMQTIMFMISED